MRIEMGFQSSAGVRALNEDAVLTDAGCGIAIVADGVSRQDGGVMASVLTVDTIGELLRVATSARAKDDDLDVHRHTLHAAVRSANRLIYDRAAENGRAGEIGSTVVVAWVAGSHLLMANVGDTRAYRLRDGALDQLTEDDSLMAEETRRKAVLAKDGAMVLTHLKNGLTRTIGKRERTDAHVSIFDVKVGDTLALCSDGVWAALTQQEIARRISGAASPDSLAAALVDAAAAAGSNDNLSAVIVRTLADE